MKLSLFCSVFLLLLCSQVGLGASTSISLSASYGSANDFLDVPVRITTDDRVAAMQADILYDPNRFNPSLVSAGKDLGLHDLRFNIVQPGRLRVVITSLENEVLEGGELFRVQGALLTDSTETHALNLSALILSDEFGVRVGYAFAPFISILSPSDAASLNPGEEVEIQAVTFSQGASVREVEIFVNGQSLGLFSEGPFTVSWTPLEAGQALLTAVVRSTGDIEASADPVSVTISGNLITGISAWLDEFFTPEQQNDPMISGLFVDPDLDGLLNIFEYATGTFPLAFTPETDLPQVFLVDINEDTYLALRYRLRASAEDIVAEVQVSGRPDFLDGFRDQAILIETLPIGSYFLNTERDSVPISQHTADGGRFIRLLITEAPTPTP